MLRLKNVRKYFSRNLVLDIPSLELENNIYWVKGGNGSGKSTLLRMVAGLLPFEGRITFKDADLSRQPVMYRRHISWADAEPLFPAFTTGAELMEFYRRIRGSTTGEVGALTGVFGMQEYIHLKTGTYSSGTLKKLSLMLAFLGHPSLILLDEPLITLDTASLAIVCDLVQEKHESGSLFLLSSHQQHEAPVIFSGKQLLVSNQTVQLL